MLVIGGRVGAIERVRRAGELFVHQPPDRLAVIGRRVEFQTHVETMANPFEFVQQVRAEAAKVVWPTRRETLITTGLVLLLVVFTSLFFLVVDEVLRTIVSLVLGFGRTG